MLRKSIGSMADDRATCERCARTPLVGEHMYRLESGRFVCDLCLKELPRADREPLSTERMPAGERTLRVAPKPSPGRGGGDSDPASGSASPRAA
jgi:hypothetical protein